MLTVPNLLSLLRLAGVPLFLYLLLGPRADGWAIVVLAARRASPTGSTASWPGCSASTAGSARCSTRRWTGSTSWPRWSRWACATIVPWWAVGALVARDLVLAATLPVLRRRGYGPYLVTYLGKGATFLLLYAFPLLLLGQGSRAGSPICAAVRLRASRSGAPRCTSTPGLLYLAQFVLAMRTPAAGAAAPGAARARLAAVIPEDLRYTDAHEWVRELGDGVVRIGITDHAQSQLGDVVFVQLPAVGDAVAAGAAVGEVESTKSVSDIYAPVGGHGRRGQRGAGRQPRAGQLRPVRGRLDARDPARRRRHRGVPDELLDAAAYRELTGS